MLLVIVTVAQHVSGGGSRARYLLPALGVAAALFALGLDRLWPRVLPAAPSCCSAGGRCATSSSGSTRPPSVVLVDGGSPMPELSQVLPASPRLRTAAGFVIFVGCVLLAVWIATTAARAFRRE